jgi:hypothetical protein
VNGIDPDEVPSIDVVERALMRGEDAYRARAQTIDTKAGLVLAAAGVLIALVGTRPGIAGLVAQVLAVLAGTMAVLSLRPRKAPGLSPRRLRDKYLGAPSIVTRVQVLSAGVETLEEDEDRLLTKNKQLATGALLLLAAAVAIVVGAAARVVGS